MKSYLRFFKEISSIPRKSGNTEGIAGYLSDFAASRGLECYRDAAGNVLMRRGAVSAEKAGCPSVLLQAHSDMVMVTSAVYSGSGAVDVVDEGGVLRAKSSTLGADDGMGCSYILAVLDDMETPCPAIEALFTVDEETDMRGVRSFDFSRVSSKYAVNLDSEREGEAVRGCACGMDLKLTFGFEDGCMRNIRGSVVTVCVSGLPGGHSGLDIDCGRPSAFVLLSECLFSLYGCFGQRFVSFSGGSAANAIPDSACVRVLLPEGDAEAFAAAIEKKLQSRANGVASGLKLTVSIGDVGMTRCLSDDGERFFHALCELPHGVVARNGGEVFTSVNLGLVSTKESGVEFVGLIRSHGDSDAAECLGEIERKFGMFSGDRSFSVSVGGKLAYGAWNGPESSKVLDALGEASLRLLGKGLVPVRVHAGLECSVMAERLPGCDIVSIGPTIAGAHTVDERAEIASCDRCYDLLVDFLKNWE